MSPRLRAIVLALLLFAGLARPPLAAAEKKDGKVRRLDDFETKLWPWSNESADDPATLRIVPEKATSGKRSLRVDFEAFGREKFQVRRDGRIDLGGESRILVDIYNGGRRMRMALGLETGQPPKYYESSPVNIEPGWNRDVSISLTDPTYSHGNGVYRYRPDHLRDTLKLSLMFFEDGAARGVVYIDNLRAARAGAVVGRAEPPKIALLKHGPKTVPVYGRFDVEVDLQGTFKDYFSREDAEVWANFYSPGGKKRIVHGFFDGFRADRSPALPVWRIRFCPTEPGRWIYDVTARTPHGRAVSGLLNINARRDPKRRGFIRICPNDRRYFEYDDKRFFYVIGQNVAWASDIGRYFESISAYGGNVARVWLCPWHLPLERKDEPGRYDLNVARQLDAVVDLAEANDIRLMLVLFYHGALRESWKVSPYNVANGGPCRRPQDFFTDPAAIAQTKRFVDYLCARYGYSTRIFAWELFNEANFTDYGRFSDVVNWAREIGGRFRKSDPNRHLITVSAGQTTWRRELFVLSEIDFLSPHLYTTEMGQGIDRIAALAEPIGKPTFLGEFAGYPNAADERDDREGVYLHAGLWYSFTTPWAGAGLPWWWDSHIEADDLGHHFRALAAFAKGVDRRGHPFRLVETRIQTGGIRAADVRGLLAPALALVWVFDSEQMRDPKAQARPVIAEPSPLKLTGMAKGEFQYEVWDTWAGKALKTGKLKTRNGRLRIPLPASKRDVAVKVLRVTGGAKKR